MEVIKQIGATAAAANIPLVNMHRDWNRVEERGGVIDFGLVNDPVVVVVVVVLNAASS